MERDPTYGRPPADAAPDDENASGPLGELRDRGEDTSGGPLSSGAGEGAGQGGPEGVDVPGGASEGVSLDDPDAVGGGGHGR